MTTPADNVPVAIIADAMRDAGLLQQGDEPQGEAIAENMRRLRDLVNYFMTKGIKLWLNVDTEVPITAGVATYTFSPTGSVVMTKPLRVVQGYFQYSADDTRRPLNVLSWDDFLTLSQVGVSTSSQGTINSYFVDKQQTRLSVTFWLCPDDTEVSFGNPHVLLQVQATRPVTLTETMNFPDEWRIALRWGLAADICTGQPQATVAKCMGEAEKYRMALEDWDVEDAPTQFTPDPRTSQGTGRFK